MAQQATTLRIASRVAVWTDRPGEYNLALLASAFLVIAGAGIAVSVASPAHQAVLIGSVAVAGLVAVILFARPVYTIYLLILGFVFLSGLERGAFIPSLRPNELFLLLVLAAFLIRRMVTRCDSGPGLSGIDTAFFVFALAGIAVPMMGFIWRGGAPALSDLLVMVAPLQYWVIYRLVLASATTAKDVAAVLRVLLIVSAVVAVIAILQVLGILGVRELLDGYYSFDIKGLPAFEYVQAGIGTRATSVFEGSWNTLGAYLTLSLLIALIFYLDESPKARALLPRPWLAAVIGLDGVGLILSGSLSAWLGLLFGFVLVLSYLYFSRSRAHSALLKLFIVLVSLALTTWLIFQPIVGARFAHQFGRDGGGIVPTTLDTRFEHWSKDVWPAAQENFILGLRPDTLDLWASEESYYFSLLLRGGVLFFAGYVVLLFTVLRRMGARNQRLKRLGRTTAAAAGILFLVIALMNVSNAYFEYSAVGETLWVMLALAGAGLAVQRGEAAGKESP